MTTKEIVDFLKFFQTDTTTAILISGGSVVLYVAWRLYKTGANRLEWGDAIAVFLAAFSVLGGLRVIVFGLENTAHSMGPTEQTYIVIGGGAVIWNGCKTLRKKVLDT